MSPRNDERRPGRGGDSVEKSNKHPNSSAWGRRNASFRTLHDEVTLYRPTTVKRRRRSNVELGAINEAIVAAVRDEHPVTLRGVFYQVVSYELTQAVERSERQLLTAIVSGGAR